jgi:hypothetical protein
MLTRRKGAPVCTRDKTKFFVRPEHSLLIFEKPDVEELAEAIWQRQRDALQPGAIFSNAKWRDQSIPSRFWNEFLLDAQAVLSLLDRKHTEYNGRKS